MITIQAVRSWRANLAARIEKMAASKTPKATLRQNWHFFNKLGHLGPCWKRYRFYSNIPKNTACWYMSGFLFFMSTSMYIINYTCIMYPFICTINTSALSSENHQIFTKRDQVLSVLTAGEPVAGVTPPSRDARSSALVARRWPQTNSFAPAPHPRPGRYTKKQKNDPFFPR